MSLERREEADGKGLVVFPREVPRFVSPLCPSQLSSKPLQCSSPDWVVISSNGALWTF